jgi:serine/threonine protein phosphatase PrpC
MVFYYSEAVRNLIVPKVLKAVVTIQIVRIVPIMVKSDGTCERCPSPRNLLSWDPWAVVHLEKTQELIQDSVHNHDRLIILDRPNYLQPLGYLEKLLNCWSNSSTLCSDVDSEESPHSNIHHDLNKKNEIDSSTASPTTFRQRRLTQVVTSVAATDNQRLANTFTQDTNTKDHHKNNTTRVIDAKSLPLDNHSAETLLGCAIFTCHGMEPKTLNHSMLVEEMSCASMIHDSMNEKNFHPIKISSFHSLVKNLFSRVFLNPSKENYDLPKVTTCPNIALACSKINQDRAHILTIDFNSSIMLGVYDGHGDKGELVAEYVMRAMERKLPQKYTTTDSNVDGNLPCTATNSNIDNSTNIQEMCTDIFREIDLEIAQQPHLRPLHSGSTACIVLLSPSKVHVANVGDSRAVLGYRVSNPRITETNSFHLTMDPDSMSRSHQDMHIDTILQTIELSKDQNANDPIERQRILGAGGYVTLPRKGFENEIPARVWLDERCTQIGLGMSRSFGDFALKDVGVIVDPVVTTLDIEQGHEVCME